MRCKFVISLIQNHNYMAGSSPQKVIYRGGLEHHAGRIIRVRQKHKSRVNVDGGENRFQIKTIFARPHWRFYQTCPSRPHRHRIQMNDRSLVTAFNPGASNVWQSKLSIAVEPAVTRTCSGCKL